MNLIGREGSILLKTLMLTFYGVALSACQTAELVFYEHKPSKRFYQDLNMGDPLLSPFFDNGVLFVASIKAATHTEYFFWIGVYSEKKEKVKINKAIVMGSGLNLSKDLDIEVFSRQPTREYDAGNPVKLFELKSSWLGKASNDDGAIVLDVFYEIGGKEGKKRFVLKRRVEKQTVFST
ncbi:hypothetical protein ACL7TT_17835 [Microbulbifer sp. 2304DJ12-6]|uniref:hypothetical protein n=1 Tax=Microbulbifer sp. 2304DJ12-6 TaxID=3233340 RepID=UPI0039AFF14D